jgi:hypothetical protein
MVYSKSSKIVSGVGRSSLRNVMKIKTAFIIFAILVQSFICLRSATATTGQLPLPDKQISSVKSVPFRFLSCFGGGDVDDCDDIDVDAAGNIYLACHSTSKDFPGSKQRDGSQDADRTDAYVEKISGVSLAQQNEPVRAPFFQGEGLPTPPQQNAPWPHVDDALSNAAAMLFEQGLADPRGLESRSNISEG